MAPYMAGELVEAVSEICCRQALSLAQEQAMYIVA
jgi:hypothetical protein